MSPAYSALRDGNEITVPSNYLPPTYEAPAFRGTRGSSPTAGPAPSNGQEQDVA
jgi:hypothetical protein